MVTKLPIAVFPGKNTDPQSTEALVDIQRRPTGNWRRWFEFVDIAVRRMMVTVNGVGGSTGFGFSTSGLFTNKEELGMGIFPVDITFPSTGNSAAIVSLVPAAAPASITVVPVVGGIDQPAVGSITWAAGGTVPTVTWTPNPYILPANTPFKLYAPSPADATLSHITAFIPGDL